VVFADAHTIETVVCGELTPDQQSRLSKEIWREAERIESESLKDGFEMVDEEGNVVRVGPELSSGRNV
jgi:hypothetical protein